jgi:hypothetical protein
MLLHDLDAAEMAAAAAAAAAAGLAAAPAGAEGAAMVTRGEEDEHSR